MYTLMKMYDDEVINDYGWMKKTDGSWQEHAKGKGDEKLKSTSAPKDCILGFDRNIVDLKADGKVVERRFIQLGDIKDRKFIMRVKLSKTDWDNGNTGAIDTRDRLFNDFKANTKTTYVTCVEIPTREDYEKLFAYKDTRDPDDKTNEKWYYGVSMNGEHEFYTESYNDDKKWGRLDTGREQITTVNIRKKSSGINMGEWSYFFTAETGGFGAAFVDYNQRYRLVVVLESL